MKTTQLVLLALICLYSARTIPWISMKTGINVSDAQLIVSFLYLIMFLTMVISRQEYTRLFEGFGSATVIRAGILGVGIFILSGIAYFLMANLYVVLGWEQPKELIFFDVKNTKEIVSLIVFVFTAVLLEEYVFRGLILSALKDHFSVIVTLLISSLVFALYHLSFFQLPATFILGLGLGFLYIRSNSLFSPMIAHLVFNFLGIGLFLTKTAAP